MISSLQSEGVDPCTGTLHAIAQNANVSRMSSSLRMLLRAMHYRHYILYVLTSRPICKNNLLSATLKIPFQPKSTTAVQFK